MPTGTGFFETCKGGKQPLLVLWLNPFTVVTHPESHTPFVAPLVKPDFDDRRDALFGSTTVLDSVNQVVGPHFLNPRAVYEFGTNVFQGLSDWGVEFVDTMMNPGTGYGSPWIMNGPFRLYETGSSSAGRPVYYSDFMSVPGHPEFDGQFFNCVTEIRDDAGYEWYPSSDVAGTIGRGTRQTKRALDSMALATLFTHGYFIPSIPQDSWRAILQGITDNIASYDPIYVTLDHACQYVRAMHTSNITASSYDPATRQLTTSLGGEADMPTMFYLFTEQGGDIHHLLIDVPTFSGSTTVDYTLAGPLDHIVVTPAAATVATGGQQQFAAQGYDANDNPIPNLPFTWSVISGGGAIDNNGLFTADLTPGTFVDTVQASYGGVSGYASVEVVAPAIDHFTFEPIASPQYVDVPFEVTITARDISGNPLAGYFGSAALSDTTGTLDPTGASLSGGVWTGEVTIGQAAHDVILTATDGDATGSSESIEVLPMPMFYQVTSPAYEYAEGEAFPVTVTAYQGATINLWEDDHQDPILETTSDATLLESTPGEWTEFYYSSRPFPSVMAAHDEYETYGLPVMHFTANGIPNGEYEVIANLYDNSPMRYFYGFASGDPLAQYVDTAGGASGTQHREYSLGTVQITGGTFDLYVQDADILGGTYPFFGWAWIRLEPTGLLMSSNSATMAFDADGNGIFGEPGDDVKSLVDGSLTIMARDTTPGTDVTVTATDSAGRYGYNLYNIYSLNEPPVANDDEVVTDEDVPVTVDVLVNDTDPDDNLADASAAVISGPDHGTVEGTYGSFTYTPDADFNGSDSFDYEVCDTEGLCDTATVYITVTPVNDPPTVSASPETQTVQHSDAIAPVTFTAVDVDSAGDAITGSASSVPADLSLSAKSCTDDGEGTRCTWTLSGVVNVAAGTYVVLFTADDSDATGDATTEIVVLEEGTQLAVEDAAVQYSDSVELSATLTDDDATPLAGQTLSFSVGGGCQGTADTDATGMAVFRCDAVPLGAGDYTIEVGYAGDTGYYEPTSATGTLAVVVEDARVRFDDENPVSVQVVEDGGNSGTFSLAVSVREAYNVTLGEEPAGEPLTVPGDISLAQVSMTLMPVGPGGSVVGTCAPADVTGTGYDARLAVVCQFDAVPVNTYVVETHIGGSYYAGYGEDVLTIYDPSLGFATGGGWFYWPGTEDRTNFGFTMKYNKKGTNVRGSLLLIRHLEDDAIYRVKSNALYGLAMGVGPEFGWASFSGKATYLEPGWMEVEGNHEFIVYVEDRNEPGTGADRFWIEVRDKDNVAIADMSMPHNATEYAEPIEGGNIVAPH